MRKILIDKDMQLTQKIRIYPTIEQEYVLWILSEKYEIEDGIDMDIWTPEMRLEKKSCQIILKEMIPGKKAISGLILILISEDISH